MNKQATSIKVPAKAASAGASLALYLCLALLAGASADDQWNNHTEDGRMFSAVEFRVNQVTAGDQDSPVVVALEGGKVFAAWRSFHQNGYSFDVYATIISHSGDAIAAPFRVNQYTLYSGQGFEVAAIGGDKVVAVWESYVPAAFGSELFIQLFNSTGHRMLNDTYLSNEKGDFRLRPALAGISDNRFVVAYERMDEFEGSLGVFAQVLYDNGTQILPEFQVTNHSGSDSDFVIVDVDQGQLLFVWEHRSGSSSGVFARLIADDGAEILPQFQVNNQTGEHQGHPAAASMGNGLFVIAWHGANPTSFNIFAQVMDTTGALRLPELQVNAFTCGDQTQPSVAAIDESRFLVGWETGGCDEDWGSDGVHGRVIELGSGQDSLPEFRISSAVDGEQQDISMASVGNDSVMAVWESRQETGHDGDIAARLLAFDALPAFSTAPSPPTSSSTTPESTTSSSAPTTPAPSTSSSSSTPEPTASSSSATPQPQATTAPTTAPTTSPEPAPPTDPACGQLLARASGCVLWAREDVELGTGHIAGKVCVGGSLRIGEGVSIGAGADISTADSAPCSDYYLVVGNEVDWINGAVHGPDAAHCVGGAVVRAPVGVLEPRCPSDRVGGGSCAEVVDFASDYASLQALSDRLASVPAGYLHSRAELQGGVILISLDASAAKHAVSLNASLFEGWAAWGLRIEASPGTGSLDDVQLVVINLDGVGEGGLELSKWFDYPFSLGSRVLFNHPGSEPIGVAAGTVIAGSVLAPRAVLSGSSAGAIHGQAVVKSYHSSIPSSVNFVALPLLAEETPCSLHAASRRALEEKAAAAQPELGLESSVEAATQGCGPQHQQVRGLLAVAALLAVVAAGAAGAAVRYRRRAAAAERLAAACSSPSPFLGLDPSLPPAGVPGKRLAISPTASAGVVCEQPQPLLLGDSSV